MTSKGKEDWHQTAQQVSAAPVKKVAAEEHVPPKDDAEMQAIVAAARVRLVRGEEKTSVPIADVAAHKLDGWVLAPDQ